MLEQQRSHLVRCLCEIPFNHVLMLWISSLVIVALIVGLICYLKGHLDGARSDRDYAEEGARLRSTVALLESEVSAERRRLDKAYKALDDQRDINRRLLDDDDYLQEQRYLLESTVSLSAGGE